jgi:hypothetical protein
LSAAVADVYRSWLRDAGKTGNRPVVGHGTLLDPRHVVRVGLVPYWSPRPGHRDVDELEYWLAGSEPFGSIEVLVEATCRHSSQLGPRGRLVGLSRFGTDHGRVDPASLRRYPLGVPDPGHATTVLRGFPYDQPTPPPLAAAVAVEGLDRLARHGRLLLT